MQQKIVLADFLNDQEYHAIKAPHGTAFATLELHREALKGAIAQMRAQGYEVAVEICDQPGYEAFCKLQKALNTPQTVSAYVVMKHGNMQQKLQPGLQHQNITIHRSEPAAKKLWGIRDDAGEIYAVYTDPSEVSNLDPVLLVENPTWETSDWTENETNYIAVDRLAALFDHLCKSTGMKKKELARICGKSVYSFSKYCSGEVPVPALVWEKVEALRRNF
ncbi:MAG: hypothetical protein IIV93_04725 [Clostridia bacterium]|nr:hypothetical protein [Clostridia bacterium]